MNLEGLSKLLAAAGLLLVAAAGLLWALGRLGFGRLPGDLMLQGRHWKVYFPLATSLLLSLLLTLLLNLLARLHR